MEPPPSLDGQEAARSALAGCYGQALSLRYVRSAVTRLVARLAWQPLGAAAAHRAVALLQRQEGARRRAKARIPSLSLGARSSCHVCQIYQVLGFAGSIWHTDRSEARTSAGWPASRPGGTTGQPFRRHLRAPPGEARGVPGRHATTSTLPRSKNRPKRTSSLIAPARPGEG